MWDKVLDSHVSFLEQPALAKANPAEWYQEARRLFEFEDAEPAPRDKVVAMVQKKVDIMTSNVRGAYAARRHSSSAPSAVLTL